MNNNDKIKISEHMVEAMIREDLSTRAVGKYLGVAPMNVSMLCRQTSFPSISKEAWERFEQWHLSREKISDFKVPVPGSFESEPAENKELSPEATKTKTEADSPELVSYEEMIKNTRVLNKEEKAARLKARAKAKAEDPSRIKIALDININLFVNGQKVRYE